MGSCHIPLRLVRKQILPASATLHRFSFIPAGTFYKQKLTMTRLLGEPQTLLPSLVSSQHQHATSDTSPSAGSPPQLSWAPRHSCTTGGKDGVPLPRCPACLVIFSPPVVDTSGVSCSMVRTQPFRNCDFKGSRATLTRKLSSLSLSSVVCFPVG